MSEPRLERQVFYPLTWQLVVAATLALGAGVMHFVYAPMHLAEARGQGIFFLVLGFTQVGWGVYALRNPTPRSYLFGLVAATSMPAVLYAVTRVIAAPFAEAAESVDVFGAFILMAEAGGAMLLAWHGIHQGIEYRRPNLSPTPLAVVLVVAGIVAAGALFGLGLALDATVPWLGEAEGGEGGAGGHHATPDSESPLARVLRATD